MIGVHVVALPYLVPLTEFTRTCTCSHGNPLEWALYGRNSSGRCRTPHKWSGKCPSIEHRFSKGPKVVTLVSEQTLFPGFVCWGMGVRVIEYLQGPVIACYVYIEHT